ncbi:hypothetical protein ACLOJK_029721 [Asimina triloba]
MFIPNVPTELKPMFTAALKALPTLAIVAPPIRVVDDDSSQPTGAVRDNFNLVGDEFINVEVHALGPTNGVIASQSSQACNILNPHVVKMKGRMTKRFKGPLEQIRGGMKLCRGCNEKVIGHDKRNCSFLKAPPSIDVTDDTCSLSTVARGRGRVRRGCEMGLHFFWWYDEWGESMSGGGIDDPTEAHSHTQLQEDISPGFMELVRSIEALKISHRTETSHTRQMHKSLAKIILRMDMELLLKALSDYNLPKRLLKAPAMLMGMILVSSYGISSLMPRVTSLAEQTCSSSVGSRLG